MDLRVHLLLANPPRDELRVLRTEVEDQNKLLMRHRRGYLDEVDVG